jgi:hypothetical protein
MSRGRWPILPAGLAGIALLTAVTPVNGIETQRQLLSEIQKEQNLVRKAKKQILLSRLEFAEVQDAYLHGHFDQGAKLLATFSTTVDDAWKNLVDSGRKASKQSDGFRQLEIALRENARALDDLKRSVDYFDREPLESAETRLEQTHAQVIVALFPSSAPKPSKNTPRGPAENAGAPAPPR